MQRNSNCEDRCCSRRMETKRILGRSGADDSAHCLRFIRREVPEKVAIRAVELAKEEVVRQNGIETF